uniref:Uncharacterized protein n=1 Tax=Aegilops tauschii subsp. strangulata TaxID=200361 RepID=A0A452ZB43_AEGTS
PPTIRPATTCAKGHEEKEKKKENQRGAVAVPACPPRRPLPASPSRPAP